MGFISFITDKKKVHQALFILPLLTFYLTKGSSWLFFIGLVILAMMEVYKIDLENKIPLIIKSRVNTISKGKPLLRNWRDQLKDAGKEFSYIYNWKFFGLVSLIFIVEFVYSAIISLNYSYILFGVHLFLAVYFILLELMINHNVNLLAKKPGRGKRK